MLKCFRERVLFYVGVFKVTYPFISFACFLMGVIVILQTIWINVADADTAPSINLSLSAPRERSDGMLFGKALKQGETETEISTASRPVSLFQLPNAPEKNEYPYILYEYSDGGYEAYNGQDFQYRFTFTGGKEGNNNYSTTFYLFPDQYGAYKTLTFEWAIAKEEQPQTEHEREAEVYFSFFNGDTGEHIKDSDHLRGDDIIVHNEEVPLEGLSSLTIEYHTTATSYMDWIPVVMSEFTIS